MDFPIYPVGVCICINSLPVIINSGALSPYGPHNNTALWEGQIRIPPTPWWRWKLKLQRVDVSSPQTHKVGSQMQALLPLSLPASITGLVLLCPVSITASWLPFLFNYNSLFCSSLLIILI